MASVSYLSQVESSYANTCPVKALMKYIEKVFSARGDYILNDNGSPKGMFFQDSVMKDIFNFFPDRVCIDCSFKKFEIDIFMFSILCEDSNGQNFIIAVGFLQYDDAESLIWLLKTFKNNNPNWRKIRYLSVDPSIRHWEIVKDFFEYSYLMFSSYHAIKTFKIHLDNKEEFKNLPESMKNHALDLFKILLSSTTASEYTENLQKWIHVPEVLSKYLLKVWTPHEDKWRFPLDFCHEDIFRNRNEYLVELNNAIKMIFEAEETYVECIKKIFLFILLKKREKPKNILKRVNLFSRFSTEYQICKTLTPYAAEFVIKQLDLSQVMFSKFNPLSDCYSFKYLDVDIQASSTSCQCSFFLYTFLPCRHIFCARKTNNFCLFASSNIGNTWSKQYYEHATTCMEDFLGNSIDSRIPHDLDSRFMLASHLFEITTSILFDSSKNTYESRIKLLKNLVEVWKRDQEVSVKFIGIEKPVGKHDLCDTRDSNLTEKLITSQDVEFFDENPYSSLEVDMSVQNQLSEVDVSSVSVQSAKSLIIHCEPKRASRHGLYNLNHCLLSDKHINLAYIINIICLTKESCVNWLKVQGFLPTCMKCSLCNGEMLSKNLSRLNDGVTWHCPDKMCMGKKTSIRTGTWFEESNLTLQHTLILTYMWINKFPEKTILLEILMNTANYVKWDKFYRRVCVESNDDSPVVAEICSPSYEDSLDKWLQKCSEKDTFLEFLKDAAYVYGKD